MQKDNNANKYQILSSLFLFIALAGAVAALCFWIYLPTQSLSYYIPAGCSVAFFLAYVIVCAVASKKCEQGKSYFLLAWAIVAVSAILISLLPIAAVLWVLEAIVEKLIVRH